MSIGDGEGCVDVDEGLRSDSVNGLNHLDHTQSATIDKDMPINQSEIHSAAYECEERSTTELYPEPESAAATVQRETADTAEPRADSVQANAQRRVQTALHMAVSQGDVSMIGMLLERCHRHTVHCFRIWQHLGSVVATDLKIINQLPSFLTGCLMCFLPVPSIRFSSIAKALDASQPLVRFVILPIWLGVHCTPLR